MTFYVKIWTWMASNNTISWSSTYEILTYFRRELGFASYIHVSTPRWSMSIFLFKSDGGTPQNIRFNVFVILKCSIHGESNTWHVKSWRFTREVDPTTPGVLLFPTCYWRVVLVVTNKTHFLDLYVRAVDHKFITGIYHKVDDFNFEVISYPFP